MAEKKYIIDDARLMAEWDWEKNNELGFDPKTLTLGCDKKSMVEMQQRIRVASDNRKQK